MIVLALIVFFGALRFFLSHQSNTQDSFYVKRSKIIGPNGKQFVPYGVVIDCAAKSKPVTSLCQGKYLADNTALAQVNAAAAYWDMNIIRFNVAQEQLFSSHGNINHPYLKLIDDLVRRTNQLGMVATITLQEEYYKGPAFPTLTATRFWKFMAQHYRNDPDVFFDLYNEPRLPAAALQAGSHLWNIWRNGGTAYLSTGDNGTTNELVHYVGMQSLVNTIRQQGARNIIIAEGTNYDENLGGLPTHLLTGGNIAYGIEPNLRKDPTQPSQYLAFGQYTKKWPIVPESFLDRVGSKFCDPLSPTQVPQLLSYLKRLHMGLLFWTMIPGIAIVGKNLDRPTSYPSGARTIASPMCPYKGHRVIYLPHNTIGAGSLIMSFYKENSVRL